MGQFGEELRRERESRGISIEHLCATTKVSSRHFNALEAGRYRELPGGVFRKGIVRSYLDAVGLRDQDWLNRFEASLRESGVSEPGDEDWAEFAENVRKNRIGKRQQTGLRWFGVILMLLALIVCGWLIWNFALRDKLLSQGQGSESSIVWRVSPPSTA